jgi:CubicO group peptidase (beta-lactamase class C family)
MSTHGWTASGFEGVRDAFEKNFADGLEVGAAFSAYHRGQKVVDLWGGQFDPTSGKEWEEDTIALVYSTTKGATAISANRLAQEGRLDVNAPVATYWPEFAKAGKEAIPVDWLLSHRAGLAWVDAPLTLDEVLAWDPMIHALEAQAPVWEPGTQHGYHAVTYGYLVGEVIRRISGRSVGTYFREEVGDPLGLDFWIGLPAENESRVSPLSGGINAMANEAAADGGMDPDTAASLAALVGPDSMLGKALSGGGAFANTDDFNPPAVHAAEIPAAAGLGDARSSARMYAACVGEVDGVRLLSTEQVKRATTQQTSGPNKILMDMDIQFGLGFMLTSSLMTLGGPNSFGHFGAGGSVGWADPDAGFGFGYVMNRMDMGLAGDLRSYNLINACYESVKG